MAGRLNYYFRQKVTESELDQGFDLLEQADRAAITDLGLIGVYNGLAVSEHAAAPNFTVDVTAGCAYDKIGERILVPALQNVDVSVDENGVSTSVAGVGNSKIVSLFAKFTRVLSDPRTDGNNVVVYFNEAESFTFIVRQSAESATPTAPLTDSTLILLADITRSYGDVSVQDDVIDTSRREDTFVRSGFTYSLREGQVLVAFQDVIDNLNDVATRTLGNDDTINITGTTYTLSAAEFANGIITIASSIAGCTLLVPDPPAGLGRIRTFINNSQNDVIISTPLGTSSQTLPVGQTVQYTFTNSGIGSTLVEQIGLTGVTLGLTIAIDAGYAT